MPSKSRAEYPFTLIMVEGDTEVLFYGRIKEIYFSKARCKIKNLEGNWNINQKVLDIVSAHLEAHKLIEFMVCICIDRESRIGKAPIDLELIKKELQNYPNLCSENIQLYEAVQDIESWFFHDIHGIYTFLNYPKSKRKTRKYKIVEKLNHQDLSKLFKDAHKEYRKGYASKNFIEKLDLEIIRIKSKVLDNLCKFIENMYK